MRYRQKITNHYVRLLYARSACRVMHSLSTSHCILRGLTLKVDTGAIGTFDHSQPSVFSERLASSSPLGATHVKSSQFMCVLCQSVKFTRAAHTLLIPARNVFFQETLCLMQINCKLNYFYIGRIKSFTKLKLKNGGR